MGTIIAKCTENLLQARKTDGKDIDLPVDEMVRFHTDALALLGHTQNELSMKRREAIQPSLKKEYTGLYSQNVPVTKKLFGDDLQQQLNNMKASNKITHTSANADKPQGVVSKKATVKVDGTGLQTNTSKGPFIHKPTGVIRTSQKTQNSPSTKRRRGARTKYQCQWTGDSGNRTG